MGMGIRYVSPASVVLFGCSLRHDRNAHSAFGLPELSGPHETSMPRDVARVCHPFLSLSKDACGRSRVLQVQVFLSYAAPLELAHANGDPNVSTTPRLELILTAVPVDRQRQGTPLSAAVPGPGERLADLEEDKTLLVEPVRIQ
jgi:hypothetical protein